MQLWSRPWALLASHRRHEPDAGALRLPPNHAEAFWLYARGSAPFRLDHRSDLTESVSGFSLPTDPRQLSLLPLAPRHKPAPRLSRDGNITVIDAGNLPERFRGDEPRSEEEKRAHTVFLRAEDVWDRLAEVEIALADPANLWRALRKRWTDDQDEDEPRMDVIVKQARDLKSVLIALEKSPRQILRRTHKMMPISRVQEMDRRAMTWLVRQPGNTSEERAGDSQRLLGVAREENFDTLENRVLRAYCDLARRHARDYLDRHVQKAQTRRYRLVKEFKMQLQRLERQLQDASVLKAEPGVTPNFVLLENVRYRAVWQAWEDLLNKQKAQDEIWRWQSRSWEEFSALLVMVALQGLPNARLIAASPIDFRDEQTRGSWINSANPLGVFFLPEVRKVVEVQYRVERPGAWRADLAASVWLRFGSVDDQQGFQSTIPIWPVWRASAGFDPVDLSDLATIVSRYRNKGMAGALLLQPTWPTEAASSIEQELVSRISIGCSGEALTKGLDCLRTALLRLLAAGEP